MGAKTTLVKCRARRVSPRTAATAPRESEQQESGGRRDDRDRKSAEVLLVPGDDVIGSDLECRGGLDRIFKILQGKDQRLMQVVLLDGDDFEDSYGGISPGLPLKDHIEQDIDIDEPLHGPYFSRR